MSSMLIRSPRTVPAASERQVQRRIARRLLRSSGLEKESARPHERRSRGGHTTGIACRCQGQDIAFAEVPYELPTTITH